MGWLCRKITSVVDKNHPCSSVPPFTTEKCKAEEEPSESELRNSVVTLVVSSGMRNSLLLWIALNPTLAAFLLLSKIYLWSWHFTQLLMAKPGCFWPNKYIGSDI